LQPQPLQERVVIVVVLGCPGRDRRRQGSPLPVTFRS
jgi:hypothetical protein